VHVGNLRKKLRDRGGDPLIHTVRGVGYVFQKEAPG
nr:DNA-binding response regulator [Gemmatimonadota bacterium]NIR79683.1 DNA-binding response regulator [Gemmatimonadota bacterium]NIT88389.1 DNA-binding response regulator [Gemmatimonadota bacterium]NIU32204.1 DNA-binding response regulator [Gemmatimonadota bacterium]NIV62578.1 DNA-binding response regulator [Gemmatimonadota bacterium]